MQVWIFTRGEVDVKESYLDPYEKPPGICPKLVAVLCSKQALMRLTDGCASRQQVNTLTNHETIIAQQALLY